MEQETKTCPYCGEEIMAIAKKCKHCGEWLDEEENKDEEEEEVDDDFSPGVGYYVQKLLKRIVGTIILLIIALLLFEYGGWKVSWGTYIPTEKQWMISAAREQGELIAPKDQSFLIDKDGFLIRVNKKYYGLIKDERHFDAPVLQWIMLLISISVLGGALYFLGTGKITEDD